MEEKLEELKTLAEKTVPNPNFAKAIENVIEKADFEDEFIKVNEQGLSLPNEIKDGELDEF